MDTSRRVCEWHSNLNKLLIIATSKEVVVLSFKVPRLLCVMYEVSPRMDGLNRRTCGSPPSCTVGGVLVARWVSVCRYQCLYALNVRLGDPFSLRLHSHTSHSSESKFANKGNYRMQTKIAENLLALGTAQSSLRNAIFQ